MIFLRLQRLDSNRDIMTSTIPSTLDRIFVTAPEQPPHVMPTLKLIVLLAMMRN